MATDPKTWRQGAGFTLLELARKCGINGHNPSRTYDRYEKGENPCPADVVEVVRRESGGLIGPDDWQRMRLAFLRSARPARKARRLRRSA